MALSHRSVNTQESVQQIQLLLLYTKQKTLHIVRKPNSSILKCLFSFFSLCVFSLSVTLFISLKHVTQILHVQQDALGQQTNSLNLWMDVIRLSQTASNPKWLDLSRFTVLIVLDIFHISMSLKHFTFLLHTNYSLRKYDAQQAWPEEKYILSKLLNVFHLQVK